MANVVLIEQRPARGTRHEPGPGAMVGRADSDFLLADPDVSRSACRLSAHTRGIAIEDLGLRNGTFVNGRRVSEVTALALGDEVQFGNTRRSRGRP